MIDTIVTLLSHVWELIRPLKLLQDYEVGVVYYKGAYSYDMKQGWNYKEPWRLKEFKVVTKQDDTKKLGSQRINGWTIIPVVKYHVKNARKYYKNVLSSKDSIVDDITASAIAVTVHSKPEQHPLNLIPLILSSVRYEARKYGYYVEKLEFATCDKLRGFYHVINKESEEGTA